MAADINQANGITAVSDCSKWLSTIATGAITAIGFFVIHEKDGGFESCGVLTKIGFFGISLCCTVSIICFIVSIIYAGWLISSIPEAYTDIIPLPTIPATVTPPPIPDNMKVWNSPAKIFIGKWRTTEFWIAFNKQFKYFLAGIVSFSIGVIISLWIPTLIIIAK